MLDHKQQANNWSCYCCACDLASVDTSTPAHAKPFRLKCLYLQLHENSLSHIRQLCTYAHPHASIRAAVEPDQIAVAEDTWWNHQSQKAPSGQIKFVLMWAERNASRAKTGPSWLEGVRGMPWLFTTSGGISITWIRTRLWLRKANWEAASTGDRFLCSAVHPAAKWETAGGMESTLFKPESVLCKLLLWRKLLASTSRMAELWCLMIKVTLGCWES